MGNVLTTILDRRTIHDVDTGYVGGDSVFIALWDADIINAQDYYPFGMLLPNRVYQADSTGTGDYRYSFNGKEQDPEWGGNGNMYDYGFRIYNPRIAKFLSVDPLTKSYPWYTPYQFAGNKPIWAIDLDGLEEYNVKIKWSEEQSGYTTRIELINPRGTQRVNYTYTDKTGKKTKVTSGNFIKDKESTRGNSLLASYNNDPNNYRSASNYFEAEDKYEVAKELSPDDEKVVNSDDANTPINDNNTSTNAGNSTISVVTTNSNSTNNSTTQSSNTTNTPSASTGTNSPPATITNVTGSTTLTSGSTIITRQLNMKAFDDMFPMVPQNASSATYSFENAQRANAAIANLVTQLNANPSLQITISGNTDFIGNWSDTRAPTKLCVSSACTPGSMVTYNRAAMSLQTLAMGRANFMRSQLVQAGVSRNRINTQTGTTGQSVSVTITIQ
ncbi:MAG: hypothetical protein KDC92_14585 [Bacteroidetes bacterium]|nr:hypothetical protein [Bacteroidota bacterium]